MADIERRLISKVLLDRNLPAMLEAGITTDFFTAIEHQKVFAWMKSYWQEHRVTPSWRRAEEEFPGYRVLLKVTEPLSDCIERVKKTHHTRLMIDAVKAGTDLLDVEDPDPEAAQEAMQARLYRAAQDVTAVQEVRMGDVLDDYISLLINRQSNPGLIGMPTGFVTLDRVTQGLQPGQLITVIGLSKAGKSTLEMLVGLHLQTQDCRPYFVSFEMGEDEQKARYLAVGAHVDYDRMIIGQLTEIEWEHVRAWKKERDEMVPFQLCTDVARASTVSGLEAKLLKDPPGCALIDGVYLMRDELSGEQNTWIALTNITRQLKKMAQRLQIPVMISHQALESKTRVNGNCRSHRLLNMNSAGYSNSFSQDSDVLIGLERDEEREKERLIKIIAARNCASGYGVWVSWDWCRGYFGEEQPEDSRALYEDDEDDDD